MSLKKWQRWGMVAMVIAQLGVLVGMIAIHERALRKGKAYRVRCVPRDPVDLFRGRYLDITLQPLPGDPQMTKPLPFDEGYAQITLDADGFMKVGRIHTRPSSSGEYVRGRVRRSTAGGSGAELHLPFDRFYVPEDKALAIEQAFRSGSDDSYLVLRVYRGFAAVEKLVISGRVYF